MGLQAYQPSRNIDYAWEGLTVTGKGTPVGTGWVVILNIDVKKFHKKHVF